MRIYLTIIYLVLLNFHLYAQADIAINKVSVSGDGSNDFPVLVQMEIINKSAVPAGLLIPYMSFLNAADDTFIDSWDGAPIRDFAGGDTVILTSDPLILPAGRQAIDSIRIDCGASADDDPTEADNFVSLVHVLSSCRFSFSEAQQVFLEFLGFDALPPLAAIFMFPEALGPQTGIQSFKGEEFSEVLSAAAWFAMLVKSPFDYFEKPVEYFLLDCGTGEIRSIKANWFPLIDGQAWNPTIYSGEVIHGTPPPETETPSIDTTFGTTRSKADSACALLVGGVDPNERTQFMFDNSLQLMKRNLTEAPWGPNLDTANVLVRRGIDREQIYSELQKLKEGYNKIYFYFTGHGEQNGTIRPKGSGMRFRDIFYTLLGSNGAEEEADADEMCFIFETCFSGQAIEAFEKIRLEYEEEQIPIDKNISIFTSSSKDSTSSGIKPENFGFNQGGGVYSFGMHASFYDTGTDQNQDSCITLEEAHDATLRRNWEMVKEKDPQKYEYRGHELAQIEESIIDELCSSYGDSAVLGSMVNLYPHRIDSVIRVQSFDESFELNLELNSYFGWVDWLPQSRFGKPVTYYVIDAQTGEIALYDSIPFWPIIPEIPDYNAFDSIGIISSPPLLSNPDPTVETVFEEAIPAPTRDSVCALLISGNDPRALGKQKAFESDLDIFKKNLILEKLGAKLNESNILERSGISADSLLSLFKSLENKYKKIFFYYVGHGSKSGFMCTGNSRAEWLDYFSLMFGLDGINASEYCIVLDCCYAGLAIPEAQKIPTFLRKNVEIYTAANATKAAYIDQHQAGNKINRFGFFSNNFLRCYGDPEAERDGIEGISFREAFDWLFKQNPRHYLGKDIWTLSCPNYFINRTCNDTIIEVGNKTFSDLDLEVRFRSKQRSLNAIDITAQVDFNTTVQTYSSSDIFEISPNRLWSLDGLLDLGPSLQADLILKLDSNIDTLHAVVGRTGVVNRKDPLAEWQVYTAGTYNQDSNFIYIPDFSTGFQWAIAKVTDQMTSTTITNPVHFDLKIGPSPAKEKIEIQLNLERAMSIRIDLLNIQGRNIKNVESSILTAGNYHYNVDIGSMLSGTHFIQLVTPDSIYYRKIMIMSQ
ncbi:MAG: T9SS type A sorting domain-containing protein [Saprospiraceae bacterium]|nr:T9SS type A sorting domain-containing protein [Saprospiraceae bacterium]